MSAREINLEPPRPLRSKDLNPFALLCCECGAEPELAYAGFAVELRCECGAFCRIDAPDNVLGLLFGFYADDYRTAERWRAELLRREGIPEGATPIHNSDVYLDHVERVFKERWR